MVRLRLAILFLALMAASPAQPPHAPAVPPAAQASAHFDALAATNAWLATVPPAQRARSDAYFEGGYWLILWDFLYAAAIAILLLETRISTRIRSAAEQITSVRFFQTVCYWFEFSIITAVATFPLTVYESFFRERRYGLMNQTFSDWLLDQFVGLALGIVLGGLVVGVLFVVVRRLPRTWHVWGTLVTIIFLTIGIMIGPVFIAPLFNTYKPLSDPVIKRQILELAHANGIRASDVYQVDASRQSNRVSGNVSGLLGTERITLNDNLLRRCSSQAILSVMGHEMGHYVLHHIYNGIIFSSLVAILFFAILRWTLDRALGMWGARWDIRGVGDVAVVPLAVLILSVLGFVFIPIDNTFTRTQEYEADLYGINAARQPDGEAEVDLLLGEYRKLDPSPFEEFVFFDHPSGRTRIYAAMRWKAENLCLFDPALPCFDRPAR